MHLDVEVGVVRGAAVPVKGTLFFVAFTSVYILLAEPLLVSHKGAAAVGVSLAPSCVSRVARWTSTSDEATRSVGCGDDGGEVGGEGGGELEGKAEGCERLGELGSSGSCGHSRGHNGDVGVHRTGGGEDGGEAGGEGCGEGSMSGDAGSSEGEGDGEGTGVSTNLRCGVSPAARIAVQYCPREYSSHTLGVAASRTSSLVASERQIGSCEVGE